MSLMSFEIILLDCIVTAVMSACILKKTKHTKIGEFLCSHFNTEGERKYKHFQRILLYYFKKGKNATEMQKEMYEVHREGAMTE